ncbi:hypothetical protein ZIOFF_003031 [Zingiber officinale]|uniref:Reverse transcriptase Ty1/copia-type domain-containing protein n=1 Tax=Zingiber officinale TaxID=94328 RepID=A0A8J5I8P1_ZINOF|nr:hypothetical protein ZIOFF_003031 [Zingiber officinale]
MFGEFKEAMTKEFEMTDIGLMTYYLGIEVNQREDGSFISQAGFVSSIVARFPSSPTSSSFLSSLQRSQPRQATRVCFTLPHSDGEKEEMVSEEEEISLSSSSSSLPTSKDVVFKPCYLFPFAYFGNGGRRKDRSLRSPTENAKRR